MPRACGLRQRILLPVEGGIDALCICKHGTTTPGVATVTLEREQLTVVFKNVPAHLLSLAEDAACAGVQVDVREYREARAA